jgi:hypothetical protein
MMDRPGRTTIRIHDDLSLDLSDPERRRLLVRVLCELVAYERDVTSTDEGSGTHGDTSKVARR